MSTSCAVVSDHFVLFLLALAALLIVAFALGRWEALLLERHLLRAMQASTSEGDDRTILGRVRAALIGKGEG